jgi:uncharacterized protein YlxW (UPF0749 family)
MIKVHHSLLSSGKNIFNFLLRVSARAEFESSKQENDPYVLAKALVNAQMALADLQDKFKAQQEKIQKEQDKKDEELRRNIDMTRVKSKYE